MSAPDFYISIGGLHRERPGERFNIAAYRDLFGAGGIHHAHLPDARRKGPCEKLHAPRRAPLRRDRAEKKSVVAFGVPVFVLAGIMKSGGAGFPLFNNLTNFTEDTLDGPVLAGECAIESLVKVKAD